MTEDTYGFDQARVRLEEIAAQVRKKDISLEKSLDLLEEGVRLANLCTEQIDQTQWRSIVEETAATDAGPAGTDAGDETAADPPVAADGVVVQGGVYDAEADDAEPRETPGGAGSLDAGEDVPSEDSHGATEQPPAEDPDVEG